MTLTNFASTGSQDAAAGSGWTADNKRWGAGALMFSSAATADYRTVANRASNALDPGTGNFTIEGWIKTSTTGPDTIIQNNTTTAGCAANAGYILLVNSSGQLNAYASDGTACYVNNQVSVRKLTDGIWHHFAWVVTRASSSILYIDGLQEISTAINN